MALQGDGDAGQAEAFLVRDLDPDLGRPRQGRLDGGSLRHGWAGGFGAGNRRCRRQHRLVGCGSARRGDERTADRRYRPRRLTVIEARAIGQPRSERGDHEAGGDPPTMRGRSRGRRHGGQTEVRGNLAAQGGEQLGRRRCDGHLEALFELGLARGVHRSISFKSVSSTERALRRRLRTATLVMPSRRAISFGARPAQ